MFIAIKHNCKVMSAGAPLWNPHTTHITLLSKNTQKPALRLPSTVEATSHDATTVTTIAGH